MERSVPTGRGICKFLLNLGEMPSPLLIVVLNRLKRQRGASFYLKYMPYNYKLYDLVFIYLKSPFL